MLEFKIRGQGAPEEAPMVCWLERDDEGDIAFAVSRCGMTQRIFTLGKDGTGYLHSLINKDIGLKVEKGQIALSSE